VEAEPACIVSVRRRCPGYAAAVLIGKQGSGISTTTVMLWGNSPDPGLMSVILGTATRAARCHRRRQHACQAAGERRSAVLR
jgi:hypothetical protein